MPDQAAALQVQTKYFCVFTLYACVAACSACVFLQAWYCKVLVTTAIACKAHATYKALQPEHNCIGGAAFTHVCGIDR